MTIASLLRMALLAGFITCAIIIFESDPGLRFKRMCIAFAALGLFAVFFPVISLAGTSGCMIAGSVIFSGSLIALAILSKR